MLVVALALPGAASGQAWGIAGAFTAATQTEVLQPWPPDVVLEVPQFRVDIAGGLTYRMRSWTHVAFQPEMWLTVKGTGSGANRQYDAAKLMFLELPLTFRWTPTPIGQLGTTPVLLGGLSPAILVHEQGQDGSPPAGVGLVMGFGAETRRKDGGVFSIEGRGTFGAQERDEKQSTLFRRNIGFAMVMNFTWGRQKIPK